MASIPGTSRANAFYIPLRNVSLPDTNWSRSPTFRDEVDELKASLRANGQQTPIKVASHRDTRPGGKGGYVARLNAEGEQLFEVRQGQRRTVAMSELAAEGVTELGGKPWEQDILAMLTDTVFGSVQDVLSNLAENTGRADADPVARAESFTYLMTEHQLTLDALVEKTGYARDLIADSVKLVSAAPAVKTALQAGDLPGSVIRTIVRTEDPKEQLKGLDAALEARVQGANVQKMRAAANEARGVKGRGEKAKQTLAANPGVEAEEEAIRRAPGAKRIDAVVEKLEARIAKIKEQAEKHAGKGKAHSAKTNAEMEIRIAELRIAIRYCKAATVVETPA